MILLDEATKDWAMDGVWKIAPAKLSWISEGARVRIGKEASIGAWASIGARVRIGKEASIGDEASIGEEAFIGDEAFIGAKSNEAIDLGCANGYRICIAQVDGVAYIGAGCRWFTLAKALKHWSIKPDRELNMCLMMAAVHIAGLRGWSHE